MMTIIVMLILVGVTINVALNGELFTQAQTAANDTQMNADKEQLLSAIVASYDIETGTIKSKSELEKNLGDGWTVEEEGSVYKVTSPKGNVFTVDAKGNIISGAENGGTSQGDSTVPEELAKYILGQDLQGRKLWEYDEDDNLIDGILGENGNEFIFRQDPTNSNSTIHKDVKIAYMDIDESAYYIRYERNVYKFKINMENSSTVAGSLERVNTPEGNLGKYVTYKGKTWIVLYDDSEKVELISANALEKVTLGGSDFSTAKDSYNEAIKTLTDACKAATGIETGIRNVGGPEEDPETPTYVTLAELKTKGFTLQDDKEKEINELIKDIKQEDDNYKNDCEQMMKLGILYPDTPDYYWIASRIIRYAGGLKASVFSVRNYFYGEGKVGYADLAQVESSGNAKGYEPNYCGIRPVITLEAGILNGRTEEGTRTNPINLD